MIWHFKILNHWQAAPRIKELNDEVDLLTAEIQEIESKKTQQDPIMLSDEELMPYVLDLKETLMKCSIVDVPNNTPPYRIGGCASSQSKETPSTEEVLCMYQIGSPNRIWTGVYRLRTWRPGPG